MVNSVVVDGMKYDIVNKHLGEGSLAETDYAQCSIAIDAETDPRLRCVNILHEAIHVILYQRGYFKHYPKHEDYVLALGYGLYEFLRNNRNFVMELIAEPLQFGPDSPFAELISGKFEGE